MSFGYEEEQQCITTAISGALFRRQGSVLFFAAASNSGANDKEMFPARLDSVISIHGTNSQGQFQDFNPPRNQNEEISIGTLGLDVPGASLSNRDYEVYKSGTSVAAAVAAGIAGILLGYVNCKPKESTSFQKINKTLRTSQGMRTMFRNLASRPQDNPSLYLTPWNLMGKSEDVRWSIFVGALCI